MSLAIYAISKVHGRAYNILNYNHTMRKYVMFKAMTPHAGCFPLTQDGLSGSIYCQVLKLSPG